MIARPAVIAAALLVGAVLQTALFPAVTLLGVRPDLLLLVVVAVALCDGPMAGMRVGAAAGLATDLLVAHTPLGLGVLVSTMLGFATGRVREVVGTVSLAAGLVTVVVATALGTGAFGLLRALLVDGRLSPAQLLQASLAVAVYDGLLAPVVLPMIRRVSARWPVGGSARG